MRHEPAPFAVRLVTPEEIGLDFAPASVAARLLALLIDVAVVFGGLALAGAVAILVVVDPSGRGGVLLAAYLLAVFLIRNFYFLLAELHWNGRTVGKRTMGIRVVARDGGPLTADLVFARNLTREFEVFLPIQLALTAGPFLGLESWVLRLLASLWVLVMLAFPLCNRQRARLGDLAAGTLVVESGRASLLADVVETVAEAPEREAAPVYAFTPRQLDVYGIYELQVLEKVLRSDPSRQDPLLLRNICEKIKRKIGWPREEGDVDPPEFLRQFYAAQRARLERQMLLGKRRERKTF